MSDKAILDTSFLVGYFDSGDVWHPRASKLIQQTDVEGVILDCVLNEVFSVLCRRAQEKRCKKNFNQLVDSVSEEVSRERILWAYLRITHYYENILLLMRQHRGKLNFHDCLIAIVAREENIKKIISFDKDFDKVSWLERIEQ